MGKFQVRVVGADAPHAEVPAEHHEEAACAGTEWLRGEGYQLAVAVGPHGDVVVDVREVVGEGLGPPRRFRCEGAFAPVATAAGEAPADSTIRVRREEPVVTAAGEAPADSEPRP